MMHDMMDMMQAAAASLRLDAATMPGGEPATAAGIMQASELKIVNLASIIYNTNGTQLTLCKEFMTYLLSRLQ